MVVAPAFLYSCLLFFSQCWNQRRCSLNSPVRVLLADDHAVLRSGLRLLLSTQDDFEVVGEAGSGIEALELAASQQPDLILLDLSMPGLGGLEALPSLRRRAPRARILILTMHEDPQYLQQV